MADHAHSIPTAQRWTLSDAEQFYDGAIPREVLESIPTALSPEEQAVIEARVAAIAEEDRQRAAENARLMHEAILAAHARGERVARYRDASGQWQHERVTAWRLDAARAALPAGLPLAAE